MTPGEEKRLTTMVRWYQLAEEEILRLIAGAVGRGNIGTAAYYRQQHRELRRVLEKADLILRGINTAVQEDLLPLLTDAYIEHYRGGAGDMPPPSSIPEAAINQLAIDTARGLGAPNRWILRQITDEYRRVVRAVAPTVIAAGVTNRQALQSALDRFADRGVTGFVDKSGRRWRIDSYAEMVMRTARMRAGNEGRISGYTAAGVELVRVSTHPDCAPQCAPYQGRILALSGPSGTRVIDGHAVHVVATLGEAIARGYHHPNCRHVDTAYMPGMNVEVPVPVDPEKYEAAQRQRQIERHIRRWKRREVVAATPGAKQQAAVKVREWQAAQRLHLADKTYLPRRPEREQIRNGNAASATNNH